MFEGDLAGSGAPLRAHLRREGSPGRPAWAAPRCYQTARRMDAGNGACQLFFLSLFLFARHRPARSSRRRRRHGGEPRGAPPGPAAGRTSTWRPAATLGRPPRHPPLAAHARGHSLNTRFAPVVAPQAALRARSTPPPRVGSEQGRGPAVRRARGSRAGRASALLHRRPLPCPLLEGTLVFLLIGQKKFFFNTFQSELQAGRTPSRIRTLGRR